MCFSFLVSYERKGEEEEISVGEKRYVTIKNKSFVSCVSLFLCRERKGEEEEIPVGEKRYVTIKDKSFVSCVSLFLRRMRGRRDIRPRIGT